MAEGAVSAGKRFMELSYSYFVDFAVEVFDQGLDSVHKHINFDAVGAVFANQAHSPSFFRPTNTGLHRRAVLILWLCIPTVAACRQKATAALLL